MEGENSNKKKIIYVFERRHNYIHDYKMFRFDKLIDAGKDIEVWSAVNWTLGENISTPKGLYEGKTSFSIHNEEELKKNLDRVKNENCVFIVYPYHAYNSISLCIRKNIVQYGFSFYNLLENPDLAIECETKIPFFLYGICRDIKALVIGSIQLIQQSLNDNKEITIPDKLCKIYGPMRYRSIENLCITKYSRLYMPSLFEMYTRRNMFFQHLNYIKSKENECKLANCVTEDRYAVYIDEYECGHSDWEKSGMKVPIINSEKYYQEMNHFFDIIEKQLGYEVIVAAHPKAEYKGDEFGKRKIEYYKTNDLIANSELVLYTYGTSIMDIMYYKKPMIHFITSQHDKSHNAYWNVLKVDRFLHSKHIEISNIEQVEDSIYINDNIYDKWISKTSFFRNERNTENVFDYIAEL